MITVGDMVLPKSLPTHNHNYLHSTLGLISINHDTNRLGIECYLMIQFRPIDEKSKLLYGDDVSLGNDSSPVYIDLETFKILSMSLCV